MPILRGAVADAGALTQLGGVPEAIPQSGFHIEIAATPAEVDALQADWTALEGVSGPSAVFQSHTQVRTWTRHFIPPEGGRLHVAVARENGRAVLVLPLAIGGPPMLKIARMAGDPIAQYSELLADPAGDLQPAFRAAIESVKVAGADAILFRRVRDDSSLLRLARPFLRPPAAPRVAPFADLSALPDYPAYLQSLSRKTRHGLRNRRHKLAKAGEIAFELIPGGPKAREVVADAIDLKRKWLIQRGAMSSAFADPATKDCLLDIAGDSATGAQVARLMVNGETAAIRFGFEYQGTHFTYMSAYDATFSSLSPGKMLMDFILSGFPARGLKCVDMLPPASRHKSEWCHQEVGVADYTLPLTTAGLLYAAAYQERVRPGLQWTWAHMPAGLRTLYAALFLRL